jgi:hypothetical protein
MFQSDKAVLSRCKKHLLKLLPGAGELATLVVTAALLLMPAPITANELPAGSSSSDLMISSWPTALLIQRTFAQGHFWPLWNSYYGGGQPMAGDPLAALFYPPTYLVPFLPLRDYYLALFMGHLVLAGLGMLLLARRALGLSRVPALVAAVSFMATPRLISHLGVGHVTIIQTVAWYPWLALACWATVREPRRKGALLGICLALTLLAGHPQMAYYGVLMTAALAAWLLARRWRREGWQPMLNSLAGLAAAGVIGVLLASIQLLPLLEFTAFSTRQLSVSSQDAYPLMRFLSMLIDQRPSQGNPWESMLTPGLAVLVLALFALATRWRKAWPLALAIALVAGLAMGNASGFYLLIAHLLPGLDRFRGLARIWFVALMAIALLAGIGSESLLHAVRRISQRSTAAVGIFALLVVALSLIATDSGYARSVDVLPAVIPSALSLRATQLAGNGRIYDMQRNTPQLSAVQLQTPLADGWDPLLIESYVSYMQRAGRYRTTGYQLHIPPYDAPGVQPDARLLGWMHVSVVLSLRPLTDPRLVLEGRVDGTLIYKNSADAGSGYLVSPGPDGLPPSLNQIHRLDNGVRTLTQSPQQDRFTFSTRAPAYFVIAMPSFPGWFVELDGHSAPLQLIAGVLPAIRVGAGRHTLSYIYNPPAVHLGALFSAVGLLAALVWLILARGARSEQQRPVE